MTVRSLKPCSPVTRDPDLKRTGLCVDSSGVPPFVSSLMKVEDIERQYAPGECIVDAGESSLELYVVRSGSVKVVREDSDGGELLGPGAIFGELSAIAGVASPYRVCAEDETEVLVLDVSILTRLCQENADFACRLIQHLAHEVETAAYTCPSRGSDTI